MKKLWVNAVPYNKEVVISALESGTEGVSIGRNAFQHENPEKMVKALSKMVHNNAGVEDAIEVLKNS